MLFFAERENGNDFMQEGKRKMKQTMDKERWKGWLISFFMETLGGFLVAVSLDSFAVNAGFPLTGFSGIALIFNRLWGMPIGVTIILLNIPLAFLCYKLLGKGFFLRSIRCMIISSIFIDYIGPMLPAYDGDRLLAALCTGVTMGLGYGLIYMQNSSTGGADFVVMALKAVRPHLSLGRLAFITDVVIVLAGGFLFRDVDGIIYGMIVSFIFSVVIDKVMYGANAGKLTLIVTEHGKLVCDTIDMWCYAVPLGFIAAFVFKLPVLVVYFLLCTDEFVKWPWVLKRYKSGLWAKNITRDHLFEDEEKE